MATVEASIQAALFTRAASLVLNPVHPVAWPNVSFVPPANKKYLRVSHLPNTTDRLFVGNSDPHQHQGILQIMVCAPLNSGEAAARELAGLVANHFPTGLALHSGGVQVKITKRATIASALITTTELQIPVSIEYRAFTRSEEHTSELPSLMRNSYAVFSLKKK